MLLPHAVIVAALTTSLATACSLCPMCFLEAVQLRPACIPAQTLLRSSRLANGSFPASVLARAGVCNGALAAGLQRRTYSHAESREKQTDTALLRPGNRGPAGHSAPAGWPLSRSPARRLAARAPPRPRAPARVAPEKVIRHGPDSTCSVASIFWKKHRALRAQEPFLPSICFFFHSAWAPTDAGGRGVGLEENCMKDPKRIEIINAIAVHTTKLEQAGYTIVCGEIVKVK